MENIEVFQGEKKITQNAFWNYKINLHFLEFSLAIKCDKNNHKYRNKYNKTEKE